MMPALPDAEPRFNVVISGRAGVGKSSFVRALLGEAVAAEEGGRGIVCTPWEQPGEPPVLYWLYERRPEGAAPRTKLLVHATLFLTRFTMLAHQAEVDAFWAQVPAETTLVVMTQCDQAPPETLQTVAGGGKRPPVMACSARVPASVHQVMARLREILLAKYRETRH